VISCSLYSSQVRSQVRSLYRSQVRSQDRSLFKVEVKVYKYWS